MESNGTTTTRSQGDHRYPEVAILTEQETRDRQYVGDSMSAIANDIMQMCDSESQYSEKEQHLFNMAHKFIGQYQSARRRSE